MPDTPNLFRIVDNRRSGEDLVVDSTETQAASGMGQSTENGIGKCELTRLGHATPNDADLNSQGANRQ